MKKLLLTICSSLFCVLSYAQTEHLTFKGLPIDGSKQEFLEKLKRQGYSRVFNVEDDVLSGSFTGRDCYILVASTPITNTVWKAAVLFESTYDTWSLIKTTYDCLIDVYRLKYGGPALEQKDFIHPWKEGDGNELIALKSDKCVYKTFFLQKKEGVLIGCIIISMTTNCQILIEYEDTINSALLTKEKADEI